MISFNSRSEYLTLNSNFSTSHLKMTSCFLYWAGISLMRWPSRKLRSTLLRQIRQLFFAKEFLAHPFQKPCIEAMNTDIPHRLCCDQPKVLHQRQMVRYSWFLQIEQRRQFTDASLLVGQQTYYPEPALVANDLEELEQ